MKQQRLIAVFIFSCLLLNYPLLVIFNQPGLVSWMPALILYLFGVWALLIGVLIVIAQKMKD